MLLNFHGFGGNVKDYFTYQSDFQDSRRSRGVILIYPQALLLSGFSVWNAAPFAEDNKTDFDDIGFIETLIVDLKEQLSIDPERVYAAGFSTGGMFVYALACFSNESIAGVAAVSAAQLNLIDCAPSPTNVFIAHGTADDILPYYGSSDIASIEETIFVLEQRKSNLYCCTGKQLCFWKRNSLSLYYSEGINNTEVMHYKVENGKHGWFDHEIEGQSFIIPAMGF